jgi:hypothetical protein
LGRGLASQKLAGRGAKALRSAGAVSVGTRRSRLASTQRARACYRFPPAARYRPRSPGSLKPSSACSSCTLSPASYAGRVFWIANKNVGSVSHEPTISRVPEPPSAQPPRGGSPPHVRGVDERPKQALKTDVLVVGCGAAGLAAACTAAKAARIPRLGNTVASGRLIPSSAVRIK